ncbi:YadA-like family protein [Campylobacter ureolyticus]|uniref:YadA-like family protein n=1 Tax=Campylobacter ureolyticus TaxID=827 RepID=UPI0022B5A901|nr:YadA-like family protein [Campylobacter ureolyticus]MCZ6155300.1 YadA-like family protein [Campylobacter ureolyticus]
MNKAYRHVYKDGIGWVAIAENASCVSSSKGSGTVSAKTKVEVLKNFFDLRNSVVLNNGFLLKGLFAATLFCGVFVGDLKAAPSKQEIEGLQEIAKIQNNGTTVYTGNDGYRMEKVVNPDGSIGFKGRFDKSIIDRIDSNGVVEIGGRHFVIPTGSLLKDKSQLTEKDFIFFEVVKDGNGNWRGKTFGEYKAEGKFDPLLNLDREVVQYDAQEKKWYMHNHAETSPLIKEGRKLYYGKKENGEFGFATWNYLAGIPTTNPKDKDGIGNPEMIDGYYKIKSETVFAKVEFPLGTKIGDEFMLSKPERLSLVGKDGINTTPQIYKQADKTNGKIPNGRKVGDNKDGNIRLGNVARAIYDDEAVNLGQLNEKLENSKTHYVSIKSSTIKDNYYNDGAKSENAIAIGPNAQAKSQNVVSIGESAGKTSLRNGNGSIFIGRNAGKDSDVLDPQSVENWGAVYIGQDAGKGSKGDGNLYLGSDAGFKHQGSQNIFLGDGARNLKDQQGSGENEITKGNRNIAIGNQYVHNPAKVYGEDDALNDTITIGTATRASANGAIAIGSAYNYSYDEQSKLTYYTATSANGVRSIALGSGILVNSENGVAIGFGSGISDEKVTDAVALGSYSKANREALDDTTKKDVYLGDNEAVAKTVVNTKGAISVGSTIEGLDAKGNKVNPFTRQITNVAAGTEDADAVNVAQLKAKADLDAKNLSNKTGNTANETYADVWKEKLGISDTKIKKLAQESVVVEKGKNTTVDTDSTTTPGKTIYKVNVNLDDYAKTVDINEKLENSKIHYVSINSSNKDTGSNYNNDGAKGVSSIAIGEKAVATKADNGARGQNGDGSIAIGVNSKVTGDYAIALGTNTITRSQGAISIGQNADTNGTGAIAIGQGAKATGYQENDSRKRHSRSVAIGAKAEALGFQSVALGHQAIALEEDATAIGRGAEAKKIRSTALGAEARADGSLSTAVGYSSKANKDYSTAIGARSEANGKQSLALGYRSKALEDDSVALGLYSQATTKALDDTTKKEVYLGDNEAVAKTVANTKGAISVGSEIDGLDENSDPVEPFTRQITNLAAGTKDTDAVNVAQLKSFADKGLKFNANAGSEHTAKLGTQISIKGATANTDWANFDSGKNIMTNINGNNIVVGLSKDLKNINSITTEDKGTLTINAGDNKQYTFGDTNLVDTSVITNKDLTTKVTKVVGDSKFAITGDSGNGEVTLKDGLSVVGGANSGITTKAENGKFTLSLNETKVKELATKGLDENYLKIDGDNIKDKEDKKSKLGENVGTDDIANGGTKLVQADAVKNYTDTISTSLTDKGLKFNANAGSEHTAKLGTQISIKGATANTDWANFDSGKNIMTNINGNNIVVGLSKDLKNINSITTEKGGNLVINAGDEIYTFDNGKNKDADTNVVTNKDLKEAVKQINTQVGSVNLNIEGDKSTKGSVNLKTETLNINGDGKNITTSVKNGEVKVALNDEINLGKDGEIKTRLGNDGLTITQVDGTKGPSITADGIAMNDKQITGLKSGLDGLGKNGKDGTIADYKELSDSEKEKYKHNAATIGDLATVDGKIVNVSTNINNIIGNTYIKDDANGNKTIDLDKIKKDLVTNSASGQKQVVADGAGAIDMIVNSIKNINTQGTRFFHVNDGQAKGTGKLDEHDSSADSKGGVAIGMQAKVSNNAENAVSIGTNSITSVAGGVALGSGSVANRTTNLKGYIPTGATAEQEKAIKETSKGSLGVVSVGEFDGEKLIASRQITGVAAGTEDSDAVNVAQLKAVQRVSQSAQWIAADNRKFDKNGEIVDNNIPAEAKGVNSVAIGAGSNTKVVSNGKVVERPNTVSVGGLNKDGTVTQRTISNVAPGVLDSDAATMGQLRAGLNDVYGKLGEYKKDASAGTASALAVGNLPQATIPGKGMVSLGSGFYDGESAMAIGLSKMSDSGKWVFKGSASYDSQEKAGAALSVGFHF